VDWIDGALVAMHTDRVPFFDERYFLYMEDVAICLDARLRGFRVGVSHAAVAEQSSGATHRPGANAFLLARNRVLLARRVRAISAVPAALVGIGSAVVHVGRFVTFPESRRFHRLQALGALLGAAHGLAGYTGAPPRWLASKGDIVLPGQRAAQYG
jgi:GT2 family glycosyltransferase